MLSYQDAIQCIEKIFPCEGTEKISLMSALGRTLAEQIRAPFAAPHYRNSNMDGYALKKEDWSPDVVFDVRGRQLAGGTPVAVSYTPRATVKVMTGAPVPEWADAVIPVEKSTPRDKNTVTFCPDAQQPSFIREVGEDIAAGQILFERGAALTPEKIMALAAFGLEHVSVRRQPDIFIQPTGNEIIAPGEKLSSGKVFNSTTPFLVTAAAQLGLKTKVQDLLADDPQVALARTRQLLDHAGSVGGLIISTGAVSQGDSDFIPGLLKDLGFTLHFHKVAVRPGKPVLLASKGPWFWLGLPGNQISTATGWHYFARPLLQSVWGVPENTKMAVELTHPLKKPRDLHCFYRAHIEDGKATVPSTQASSHLLASLRTNAYIELVCHRDAFTAGTMVPALKIFP